MEQIIKNKNKLMVVISIIIIIAGIIMVVTQGYNFDLKYQDAYKIELTIGKEFDNEEIKAISKEQLNGQKVMVQKVEEFEDMVDITVKNIEEEQKNNIVAKINEKYGTEIKVEDIEIKPVKHVRGRDLIKPYIIPFAVATIIILIYMAVRYKKLGFVKVMVKVIAIILLAQLVLFAIMAITRLPIGRLTIPLVIMVYIISLMTITSNLERKLENKEIENNKEKNKR